MPPEIHKCSQCDLDFIELNQVSTLCFSCRGPDMGTLASNLETELLKLRKSLNQTGHHIEVVILNEYGGQQTIKLEQYDQLKVVKNDTNV